MGRSHVDETIQALPVLRRLTADGDGGETGTFPPGRKALQRRGGPL
jgi:hypothetical protein